MSDESENNPPRWWLDWAKQYDFEDCAFKEWSLQCVALGILLADPERRKAHEPESLFSRQLLACVCSELQRPESQSFPYLREFLDSLGIVWDGKQKVVEAILEQCQQDAAVNQSVGAMLAMLDDYIKNSPAHKRAFLDKVEAFKRI